MLRAARSLLALAALTFQACATEQPPAQAAANASPPASAANGQIRVPKKICENETPTGSHIATVRCRTVDESNQQRAATQTNMLRPQNTLGVKTAGGN